MGSPFPGVPFHGEFSSADASALSEVNARIALYGPASAAETPNAITLGANDVVVITDIVISNAANVTITVYDGSDVTVDAGEKILVLITPVTTTNYPNFTVPHYCQPGTYPHVKASGAGQVDVTIRGTIFRKGN